MLDKHHRARFVHHATQSDDNRQGDDGHTTCCPRPLRHTAASPAHPAALRPLLPAPPQGPPISGPTPQQSNGYDCGVYLLAVALAICRWWKKHPRTEEAAPCWFESVMDQVSAESVAAMRLNLAQKINLELIKQGDTTPSSSWPSSSSSSRQ